MLTRYHYQIPKLIILISPLSFHSTISLYLNPGHRRSLRTKIFYELPIFDFPKEKMIGQSINIIIYLDKHIISIVNIIIITILLFLIKITSLPYY